MKMLEKSMRLGLTALVVGLLAAVGLLMVVLYYAQPAEATFPGKNGRIAYTGIDKHGHDFEIFTIKPSGRGRVRVTHDKAHQEHFSFAPNGKKIAYSAPDRHSEEIYSADEEIYTMNVGGGSRFQVTNNNSHDIAPAYSPDGKRIAYEAVNRSQSVSNIYTINATGGKPVKLTHNKSYDSSPNYSSYPDYSPSGKRIVYMGSDGHDPEIYTISATGGKPFQVTHNRRADASPSYSPDGKKIAYVGRDGHDWEIYTISVTGGSRFNVTNNKTRDFEPSYSPDGKKIAYVGRAGIYTIKVTGGKPFNVTNNTTDYVGDPSWLSRP